MRRESFDVVAACELIAECDDSELWKSEPDYRPDRKDWIVVLRVKLEDGELYIKVALRRPGLDRGQFLAFKQWVD